ncbi:MAG: transketolase family protein [Candidatus Bathyarchaeia archaeon]
MSQLSPRESFGRALMSLGERRADVVVLDTDVSDSTKTSYFAERFPERFFNIGISEQDMIGTAAGLAAWGKIPIACGFAVFVAGRAWGQIRNSIARSNLNVKIVATHAGLSAHADGDSHQSFGDIALMRVIPNMTVVVPADAVATEKALEASVAHRGPVYMRIGRGPVPTIYDKDFDYKIGKASLIRDGSDAAIIANGVMVSRALRASERLEAEGVEVRVIDMHTIKPLDEACVVKAARETGAVVTAEEHSVVGGLGSAISEVLAKFDPTPMGMVGIRDRFGESSRDYEVLLAKLGLTSDAIVGAVHEVLSKV